MTDEFTCLVIVEVEGKPTNMQVADGVNQINLFRWINTLLLVRVLVVVWHKVEKLCGGHLMHAILWADSRCAQRHVVLDISSHLG